MIATIFDFHAEHVTGKSGAEPGGDRRRQAHAVDRVTAQDEARLQFLAELDRRFLGDVRIEMIAWQR